MYIPIQFLRLDFQMQTILIGLNTLLIALIPFQITFLFWVLYMQMLLGAYQLLTSLVHYFRPMLHPAIKSWRSLHLIVSAVYLIGLFSAFFFELEERNALGNYGSWFMRWALILLVPQMIAYAYYFLTRLDYRSRRNYMQSRTSF